MQRFGAPPSYPNLRIPGLNVPFADGSFPGFTRLDEVMKKGVGNKLKNSSTNSEY